MPARLDPEYVEAVLFNVLAFTGAALNLTPEAVLRASIDSLNNELRNRNQGPAPALEMSGELLQLHYLLIDGAINVEA